jgi:hypothetical protein
MMQLDRIEIEIQGDVITSFWTMLQECQSKAQLENDRILMMWVDVWYQQWNAMTGDNKRPVWHNGNLE